MRYETKLKQTEIGRIPKDWGIKELEGLFSITTGKSNSEDADDSGIYPLFDRSTTVKKSKKYLFDGKAIIIPGEGKEFDPKYFEGRFDLHQRAYALIKKSDQINTNFAYYAIKALKHVLSTYAVGSTVKSLRLGILQKFKIPFPDIKEQDAVVDILSKLDFLITLNSQMSKTIEGMLDIFYRDWLVDYEFPNEQGLPYKSNGGNLVSSKIGNIPEGWTVKPFEQVANMIRGFSYKGNEKDGSDSDYVFITLNNIAQDGGFKPEFSWIRSDRIKERHFVSETDLIVANTHFGVGGSDIARLLCCPALIFFPYYYKEKKGIYSHHITKIVPFDQNKKLFLYLFLKKNHEDIASIYRTGTSVASLDTANFMKHQLIIEPSKSILDKFNSICSPLFVKLMLNHKENMMLNEIRNFMLPKLISGKIRIPIEVKK